ncbi:amidohydrolase family protein [uncultured Thermanaerothrix sp.]|uniref:amidohydrolase family protein n=1 Tax=uncultured Thermanaerothrix sp. TaxID=1195149 RepID=UPI002628712B|nr:amidohydrolase family protein [uncultured Thermanaerothrix sp.]
MNQQPYDILIKSATILTLDASNTIIPSGAMAIKNNVIVDLGPEEKFAHHQAKVTIDGSHQVLMPGLVNAHTHAAMTLFRGFADDIPLEPWLNKIWPMEMRFATPENVQKASTLAFIEMIRAGITTAADMYWHADSTNEAAFITGLRLVNGIGLIDTVGKADAQNKETLVRRFIETHMGHSRIHPCVQVHSTYTVSQESLKLAHRLALDYRLPLITHASETRTEVQTLLSRTGKTPIGYLESLGMLHPGIVLVHCVHLQEDEIEQLSQKGVAVIHCPESNLKLGSGVAPIPALLKNGVTLGLGTDGAASNNDLDLWGEMRTAALIHKGISEDPTVVTATEVLRMATLGGARALGLDHLIGSLEIGKRADAITVSLSSAHLVPQYDLISHLVYAAKSSDVRNVIIDGNLVLHEGTLLTVDEERIKTEMKVLATKIAGFYSDRVYHQP